MIALKMDINANIDFSNSPNPTPLLNPQNQTQNRNPRLRIADVLLNNDDDDDDECERYKPLLSFLMNGDGNLRRHRSSDKYNHCSSPRRIIARCLSALRPARERKLLFGTGKRGERVSELGAECVPAMSSMNVQNGGELPVSAPESEDSGRCRRDASFNLGIACGLLYLIGESKNEMTKMVEVRKQMEMLLHDIRDELQKNNSNGKLTDNFAYSANNFRESSNFNTQLSPHANFTGTTSYVVPESETILKCDDSTKHIMHEQRLGEMDELEAELAAEFERLQLSLDTEQAQHQCSKHVMDTASSVSQSPSYGEVIDPQGLCTEELESGVRPIELERKLYELLEMRQEERIKELEEALECANHKLNEKELEVSWWKDTARLISQHVPERGRIISRHDPKLFPH
ncbi:protein POLAR-like 1 [Humulus lupulus]|uniref:protein POLAR-like 1 n=1 Tax=Humulus lupulus TaxID=3486 RepID=UPI002B40AD18|nr:protein POLAR-like 1 [Humulus lupulus]